MSDEDVSVDYDDIEKALNYIDNHFKKTDGFEGVGQTIRQALEQREWQPIETAPRDGTLILIWQDGEQHTAYWGQKTSLAQKEGWCSNGWVVNWLTFTDPTHWMPLPEPPEAEK